MQEIKREVLVNKASELLKNGTVDRVFGWGAAKMRWTISKRLMKTGFRHFPPAARSLLQTA